MDSMNDMAKQIALWLLVVVMVCCVGCAPMISSGEIVGKKFVPAHTDTNVMIDGDGMPKITTDYIPDRWYVTFEKLDEDGRQKSRTISVSKGEYDRYHVGQWISLEP